MIPKFIQNFIANKFKEGIRKLIVKYKLDKIDKLIKYVEKPNELDNKSLEHDIRLNNIEKAIKERIPTEEEKNLIKDRLESHSNRLIALEKKTKRLKK